MPAEPSQPHQFDVSVIDLLACPACLGGLAVVGERLVCSGCGRGYAIVDGIPVLIAERAVKDTASE
jgi:uncharacterized protein YbaR (Trm112 family)